MPTGVKTEGDFVMIGGEVYLQSSGSGGKGINSDEDVMINGGTLNIITTGTKYVYDESKDLDSSPKGIKADGDLTINGGNIAIKVIGVQEGSKGMESKSDLAINGGTVEIYSKDDAISASSITIKDGKMYARSTNRDAIKSNKMLKIEGGLVVAVGSAAPQGSLVCDKNNIEISGGIIMGFGGMTSNPSKENSVLSIIYGSSLKTVYALAPINGGCVMTYEIPNDYTGSYTILMSTPRLNMGGTYEICSGVTACGGTTFHGLSVDSSYIGGTSLSTITLTSTVTSLGMISTRSGSSETENP